MAAVRVEADTLLIADPSRSRSTVHIGITHPTPLEAAAFGKLYLLVEIDSTDRVNQDIIAGLQEELRTVYYRSPEFTVEHAFEAALQRANERLHRLIADGLTAWVDQFSAVVAVVKHEFVTLSSVGRIHAFLFRGSRISDIIGKGGAEEKRNPLKLFGSILTGHLQANDRLLICTPTLLDYFSQEKLKRLIVEDLPSATVAKLEQTLLTNPTPITFAAALFAFIPVEGSAPMPTVTALTAAPLAGRSTAPQRSMEELISKERHTERLLSPSIMPNVRQAMTESWRAVGRFFRSTILRLPPRRRLPRDLRESTRYAPVSPGRSRRWPTAERFGIQVLVALLAIPRAIARLLGYRRRVESNVRQLPRRTTGLAARAIEWIRSLRPLQQVLLAAAIVALFVLSQTVITATSQRGARLRGTAAEQATATIEDNLSRAEAALTYDDVAGAKRLVDEAAGLLDQLSKRTRSEKERRRSLEAKLNAVREQTRRVKSPVLETVAELGPLLNQSSPTALTLAGSTLVVGTAEPAGLLTVSTGTGKVTRLEAEPTAVRFLLPLSSQLVLIGTADGTLEELSLAASRVRQLDVTFPSLDRAVVAGSLFQSRLYLLDTKNNAILRANRAADSFGPATQWLRDDQADVRAGTALGVDGSIYVATSSGGLLRFSAGVRENTQFEDIDPPLSNPTQLSTSEQSSRLYLLEPSHQRLLVYNKANHGLQAQYVDNALQNARSFAVDERAQTVYVLTADRVIKFTLS
ncbi:MAG: hypothetical protein HY567_01850 [Candidatus Kerfeldbacteria bacterium]|nr:hypothetical protein [Candidatus Kerfeldbacteria bacterium]